jgi:hypothetical protein
VVSAADPLRSSIGDVIEIIKYSKTSTTKTDAKWTIPFRLLSVLLLNMFLFRWIAEHSIRSTMGPPLHVPAHVTFAPDIQLEVDDCSVERNVGTCTTCDSVKLESQNFRIIHIPQKTKTKAVGSGRQRITAGRHFCATVPHFRSFAPRLLGLEPRSSY